MKELYVIDGYNFLFSFYRTEGASGQQFEFFRDKLLADLVQFKNFNNCSMTVVFDAKHGDRFSQSTEIVEGIKIIYSKGGETADSIVERIVHSNEKYGRVIVITSDYLQQKVIFKENVYRRSTREFAVELEAFKKKVTEKAGEGKIHPTHYFYSVENRLDKTTRQKLDKIRKNK